MNQEDAWQVKSGMVAEPSRNSMQYARRLVSYIKDASTVRARVLEEWSSCPSVEEIRKLRKEWEELNDYCVRQRYIIGKIDDDKPMPVYAVPPHPDLIPARVQAPHTPRPIVTQGAHSAESVDVSKLTSSKELIVAVCSQFDISARALLDKSRLTEYTQARHFLFALFVARGATNGQAGLWLGGYDPASVRNGLKRLFSDHMQDPFVRTMWRKFAPAGFKEMRDHGEFMKAVKPR